MNSKERQEEVKEYKNSLKEVSTNNLVETIIMQVRELKHRLQEVDK